MNEYRPRIADGELQARLGRFGAVLIEGPRACGKTRTAQQVARSEVLLDVSPGLIEAARTDPAFLLAGERPRLIDEWQLAPELWNAARHVVDMSDADGQFIFTGSAVPADDATRHTGAGRFSRLRMRPMSLFEQGVGTGGAAISRLIEGEAVSAPASGRGIEDLIDAVCRGGWPRNLDRPLEDAMARMRDYVREIETTGIDPLMPSRRDPVRIRAVMKALARNVSTEATMATLARDAAGFAGLGTVDPDTVSGYLSALERIHVLEQVPAWRGYIRSSVALRVAPKRNFTDPSVAVAALEASGVDVRGDLEYLGLLFESLAIRDLRVLSAPSGGEVSHMRDAKGREIDAVISFGYRKWIAVEIKMASTGPRVEAAAAALLSFARRVDTAMEGEALALVVLVGSGPAYRRVDGVHVIPIWALEP